MSKIGEVSNIGSGELEPIADSENELKYGGTGGEIKAGLAGLARGATFGLSDVLATHTGAVKPETLKGLEEENPLSSLAGEAASIFVPGGVLTKAEEAVNLARTAAGAGEKLISAKGLGNSVISRLGEAAAGDIKNRIASKAVQFGTEGALYGAGQSISENALGDHDLVSGQTLANIGISGALAGGLGAVVGKLSKPVEKALNVEEKLANNAAIEKYAPDSVEGSILNSNIPESDKTSLLEGFGKQKSNAKEIKEAAELIGAPLLPAQVSDSKFVQNASSSISKAPTIPGVILNQEIQKGFGAVENVLQSTLGQAEKLSSYDAGEAFTKKVQQTVDDMYKPFKEHYAQNAMEKGVIDLSDDAKLGLHELLMKGAEADAKYIGSKGEKAVKEFADVALDQKNLSQIDGLITAMGEARSTAYNAGQKEVSHALGNAIERVKEYQVKEMVAEGAKLAKQGLPEAEILAKEAVQQHRAVTKKYAEFKEILSDLVSDQKLGRAKNVTVGGLEDIFANIPKEKLIEKAFDPKNADGLARLKKNFPEAYEFLVGQKKSQILQNSLKDGKPQIGKVFSQLFNEDKTKSFSSKTLETIFSPEEVKQLKAAKTWVEALPGDINSSNTSMAEAYRELLANPLKATISNFSASLIKKLIDKSATPQEAKGIMSLIKLEEMANKTSKKIKSGVKDVIDSSGKRLSIKGISKGVSLLSTPEEYNKKAKELKEYANNDILLHQKLDNSTRSLYEDAPNLASTMQVGIVKGIQFLASKLPPDQNTGLFTHDLEPSKTEIDKFNRYYSVVENPFIAFDQIKHGMLPSETIETLAAVHPRVYQDMKQQVVDHLTSMKDPNTISYDTKLLLSKFMGEPLVKSLNPNSIMANQALFQQAMQENAQNQQPKSKSQMKDMSLASRTGLGPRNDDV